MRPAPRVVLGAAIVIAIAALYALRLDRTVGLINDDAWYLLLAKALADGDGFRLVNSAGAEILASLYPPGFPAMLSVVFRVSPRFPDNIWLLKSVSIAAMIGVGLAAYWYFVRYREVPPALSAFLAIATVITPGFVLLATSTLMSECVFTLIQLLTVVLIERTAEARGERSAYRAAVAAGLIAAATVLTRTAGVAVVAAAVAYLAWRRQWRPALAFGSVAAGLVLSWTIYARAHEPTVAERVQHGGHIAYPYGDHFWTKVAGAGTPVRVGPADLPARVQENAFNVVARDMAGIMVPTLYRTAGESGLEVFGLGPPSGIHIPSMGNAPATLAISLLLSAVSVIGFVAVCRQRITMAEMLMPISLGITVLWPFWTYRFTLPLAPLLLFYLLAGLKDLTTRLESLLNRDVLNPAAVMRIVMLTLMGLNAWDHTQYVVEARQTPPAERAGLAGDAVEIEMLLRWMRENLKDEGTVASDNPALVYLRTGRKTVSMDGPGDNHARWRSLGIKYVVCLNPRELINDWQPYRILYQTKRRQLWVIELQSNQAPAATAAS